MLSVLAVAAAILALCMEWASVGGAGSLLAGSALGILASSAPALRARGRERASAAASPVFSLPREILPRRSPGRELAKRCVDVIVAGLAIVILAPLVPIIAAAIVLCDGGPVLYSQWRVGRDGETFRMLKFRSMRVDAEREWTGPGVKYRDDVRVTPVGRLLRRTSIDELPQLLHVLTGRMSIVGPRPLPIYEAPAVPERAGGRWSVRPGLTCSWQVSGRSDIGWEQRMDLDRGYAETWTVRRDLALICRTIVAVASRRGAF